MAETTGNEMPNLEKEVVDKPMERFNFDSFPFMRPPPLGLFNFGQ